jgi:hypothetical protein
LGLLSGFEGVTGHCGGVPPLKKEKETTSNNVRAINAGALTILGNFGRTNRRKMIGGHLIQVYYYQGACLGQAALRREQLESKH